MRTGMGVIVSMQWIPRPRNQHGTHVADAPASFQNSFVETILGRHGRLPFLELATEPSPHSAGGSSVVVVQPGEFTAAGLRKAPLDSGLARVPWGGMTTARLPL